MAGNSYTPWYVKALVKALGFAIASLAAMMALRLGGIFGWAGFGLGAFAVLELALWADWQWPDMRD
ncbi:MAG: hypothetical protein AMJ76_00180 [Dehalococcoidia bacterium SM23_28_1]|nr:MAG: hypothetical protein AMJ76_00180 [Dehalococcoidia bacterium SM23_28_1]